MDILDCARIILDRVLKFDPDNARQIVGYLLMQNQGGPEIARLASCPDHIMAEVVLSAKIQMLALNPGMTSIPPPNVAPPRGLAYFPGFTPSSPPPRNFQVQSTYCDPQFAASNVNQEFMGVSYLDSVTELQKQAEMLSLENSLDPVNIGPRGGLVNDYNNGFDSSVVSFGGRSTKRFSNSNPSEFPVKICHYFNKGYCRHGSNCRYFHGHVPHESFSSPMHMHGNGDNACNEDQVISPRSLAQIESEIIELLKQKRGNPMSIASLPMAYFERYKKALQAEGYLTESQRHGKSGYSLTKLLARLNSIRLIGRPHGQHAVILAEDAPKYIQSGDLVQTISAARQLYMTFPADSTFTEEDVANYFNQIGHVDDVRIPCQHKRMFGFVTFAHVETVRGILEKGNPHFVRGSRVLVKPYRERTRRNQDRVEHVPCCPRYYANVDSELDLIPRELGKHRQMHRQITRRQWMEEAQAFEYHKRSLEQLQFAQQGFPVAGFPADGLRVPDDRFNFQPAEALNYRMNNIYKTAETNSSEASNEVHCLPDEFPIENNN
ncbi:zinc finger CCCH domain-containing protein 18 [Lathyrus oleraceus]|uniref:Zinc finger CCCH domain-containing protein 18-like n=1 Tax=Pisum sativum TaxID=3888 RepID=A0A9D5B7K4_PEA|nr:zinc finger CCCH domain-containing protein 18-like [Pisum sativum]KAI5432831.1 hypothetical protein KIW84_020223 [Pisum sativum]